jgi:hypothetical protein
LGDLCFRSLFFYTRIQKYIFYAYGFAIVSRNVEFKRIILILEMRERAIGISPKISRILIKIVMGILCQNISHNPNQNNTAGISKIKFYYS